MGVWSGTIRRLLAGTTKPSLEVLCRICAQLNISLPDLLSDSVNQDLDKRRNIILGKGTPLSKEQVPWCEIEARLLAALQETPSPSMEEVARRMGYYQTRIRHHFRSLCFQIAARYKAYLKSKHPHPRELHRVFRVALAEQPPPSLQSVFRRLGCQDTGYYYYYNYADLCSAVAQRFKAYRNKPFDETVDRERLQSALIEEPPPSFSEMARRLGHKRDFLRRKFPELSQAIVSRHLYYRTSSHKEKAKKLREEIRKAVQQLSSAGLHVSEAKVRERVGKHLPRLGRSSLFKKALREVKAEMGTDS